ncbi:MAG: TauD/TfdA family dioxygenase [Acidobacteriota bacterium]|nr:TauD/TfdA family dioxygenase [Acidobacteriota bacterium]
MRISTDPLSRNLGAQISGVDLSKPFNDSAWTQILDAFHQHQILLFRDQILTSEQHIAFSRRFGDLEIHVCEQYLMPEHPEILLLTNEQDEKGKRVSIADGGSGWHSDLSYMKRPSLGSLLYAVRVPETGGDTEWANMYMAYETLSEETKKRLEGLKAVHQFDQRSNPRLPPPNLKYRDEHSEELKALTPDVEHPIVRTHPITGRKSLFISLRFTIDIVGMGADGTPLLDELFVHLDRPEFRYRHEWQQGDLMIWDNRCTNHRARGGVVELPQVRRLHRTTVLGDVPF